MHNGSGCPSAAPSYSKTPAAATATARPCRSTVLNLPIRAPSTAPEGPRGDLTTLDAVIRVHGGAGRAARDRYIALGEDDRAALIAFLKTLVIAP